MSGSPTRQRVIFNADDFGRSRSINEAVIRAHREGVLTTASLMVNGEAFEEAVELARANPTLGVGLHLTLVMGRATLPPAQLPDLVNERGEFTNNPVAAGMRGFFQRSLRPQFEAEIAAQLAKFRATGLVMDHLNGHLNFHLHPVIFGILMRQFTAEREVGETTFLSPSRPPSQPARAAEAALPPIRLTRDPFWLNAKLARGRWFYRASHAVIYQLLSLRSRARARADGIRFTPHVFGLLQNACVDEDYLLKLLPNLPAGDVEIYSHPNLNEFRLEFEALISPRVLALTKKLGIRRCRYQDL